MKQRSLNKKELKASIHIEGKLSDLILEFQKYLKKDPAATIETELDWSHCYYESDTPTYKTTITYNENN